MTNLLNFLKGKKTFICAALGGVVVALKLAGVLDGQTMETLLALLGFGAAASLRAAIK